MNDDLIRRGELAEEVKSLTVYVNGLRAGKGVLQEYAKQYRDSLLRIIDEQPAVDAVEVQEWISVKDRLPNPFTPVLVYRQSFGTLPPYIKVDKMTLWNDDTQVWVDEVRNWKNVTTHWMPLPKPPKGE